MTTLQITNWVDDQRVSTAVYNAIQNVEGAYNAVTGTIGTWVLRSRERSHLAMMSDRMLSDIGISRVEARNEAEKFFWQK